MVRVEMREDRLGVVVKGGAEGVDEEEAKGREAGRDGSSTGSQQPSF